MREVFQCVERASRVLVVFRDPVCHRGVCTPQPDDWQIDLLFQCHSLPRGLEVSYLRGTVGGEFAVPF
jgi:hypothetical protein